MPDINWGGDETTAPLSSRYDEASGNLILAEDNDGNTVLLEWDGTTWQYRGPIEMNGVDVSGVGTLTATDVEGATGNFNSLSTGGLSITDTSSVTVSVPSDEPTLQDAVDVVAKTKLPDGVGVEIRIEAGYQPVDGMTMDNVDFRHVTIRSDDAVVSVDTDSWPAESHFVVGAKSFLPTLDCLVDMGGVGQDGYYLPYSSWGVVTNDNGVINAGRHGLHCRSSVADASQCDFHGAGDTGLRIEQAGKVRAAAGDFSGAGVNGAEVSRVSIAHLQPSADFSGAGNYGLWVKRSYANANEADISSTGDDAVRAIQGGTAVVKEADLSGSGGTTCFAQGMSRIFASEASTGDVSAKAAEAKLGSLVVLNDATNSGGSDFAEVLVAETGSKIVANGASFWSPSDRSAVEISGGSQVTANETTFGGSALAAENTNVGSLNAVNSEGIIFA